MKTKSYLSIFAALAMAAFPLKSVLASQTTDFGGGVQFSYTAGEPISVFCFSVEKGKDIELDLSNFQVSGGGTVVGYYYNKIEGTISVTIDHTGISPSLTGNNIKGTYGGVIEIVGIDNISGVMNDNSNNPGTQTLRPVDKPNGFIAGDQQNDDPSVVVPNSIIPGNGGSGKGENVQFPEVHLPQSGNTSKNDGIDIFPNPIIDQTNIVTVGEILVRTGNVMDLSGRVVKNLVMNGDMNRITLDLSELHPGIYIVTIQTNIGTTIVKKIKKI